MIGLQLPSACAPGLIVRSSWLTPAVPGEGPEPVAPGAALVTLHGSFFGRLMAVDFSERYRDLLAVCYDCVHGRVLNAYYPARARAGRVPGLVATVAPGQWAASGRQPFDADGGSVRPSIMARRGAHGLPVIHWAERFCSAPDCVAIASSPDHTGTNYPHHPRSARSGSAGST